jgi:hypothetical protein
VTQGLWFAFVLLVAVNCIFVGAIVAARAELNSIRESYGHTAGSSAPAPFIGYREDGTPVGVGASEAGVAIWYASKRCPYCKRDLEWDKLAAALQERGVRTIILLPACGVGFEPSETRPPGAEQVAFVDGDWLRTYPLSVTPTLLIFDRDHRLIWHRWGMLTEQDTRKALAAVDKGRAASN